MSTEPKGETKNMANKPKNGLGMGGGLSGYADRQRAEKTDLHLFPTLEQINNGLKSKGKRR
jgi:hypothetical protein